MKSRVLPAICAALLAGALSAAPDHEAGGCRNLLMAGVPPPPAVVEMLPKVAAAAGCVLAVTVEQTTVAAAKSETHAFDWVEMTKAKIVPERPPAGNWDYVAMRRAFVDLEKIRGECVQFCLKYANALPKAEIVVVEPLDYAQHRGAYDFARQKSLRVVPAGSAARLLDGVTVTSTDTTAYAYLESLVWAAKLFGVKVTDCPYVPKGLPANVAARIRRAAQDAVDGVLVPPEKGGAAVPAEVAVAMAKIRAASVPQCEVQEVEYAPGVGLRVFLLLKPSAVSRIRCEVHLPDSDKWDSRLWGLGCGGWPEMRTDYVLGPSDSAVVKCDMGTLRFLPGKEPVHPEVRKDFGWRATHLAAVEAKRLVKLLYGRDASHNYFFGSSTGGRQAVGEARRFPEDYDGIIAGVPALDPLSLALPGWIHARLRTKYGRWFTDAQTKTITEAELAYFANTDPMIARGRFINDPRPTPEKLDGVWREALRRDPSLAHLENMWRELFAPVRLRGLRVFPGFVLGTEFVVSPTDFHLDTLFGKRPLTEFSESELLTLLDESDYSMRDANLERFAAHGGKLITFGGLEDDRVPPMPITEHYCRSVGVLGEETVTNFFVHYLIPGRKHAPGTWTRHGATGDPANLREVMQNWVEKGIRPNILTVPLLEESGKSLEIAPYPSVGVVDTPGSVTLAEGESGRCEVSVDGARVTGWTAADGTRAVASVLPAWPWFGDAGLPGAAPDGFAARRTFEIRRQTATSVTLGLSTDGSDEPDWDRAADCEITVTLAGGGLDVSLKTTNVGCEPLLLTAGLRARLHASHRERALLCGAEQRLPLTDAEERVLPDYSHVWRLVEPSAGRTVRVALRGNRGSVVCASIPEVCSTVHDRNDPVVLVPGETKILGMRITLEAEGPVYHPAPGPHDFAVHVPGGIPQDNEHLHVLDSGKELMAFWTQGSWEGAPDMHVAFAKSSDGGRIWSPPRVLWGPSSSDDKKPCAVHQVPLVSRSGRAYCLWAQEARAGSLSRERAMMAACSDDGGGTWTEPVRLAEPRNWCVWQRPLRLADGGRYLTAISIAEEKVTKTKFLRFENIDDDPEPKDIRFTILGDGSLEGEEASLVKLPDGRLFAVMRSRYGTPLWTQSRDGGETWTVSLPLRDADGRPIRHPRAPCPMYDMEGAEAASGHYFALFTGTYNPELQQFFGRGPLYLYHGAFDAQSVQPVRFTKGPSLLRRGPDDRYGNSCYSSFTVRGDERVLWYPDAKYNLLGVRIDGE